jgi:protein SCO1
MRHQGLMRARCTPCLAILLGLILGLVTSGCGGDSRRAGPIGVSTLNPESTAPVGSGYVGRRTLGSADATDFVLHDQHGRTVQLSAQRGKLVLLTFLYTSCPDVCPLIAENINQALRSLGPKRDAVRVLAVSVDPAHDTPSAVRRFILEHDLLPEFHYLTGTPAELKPIWQEYNLLIEVRSIERIAHSTYVLLVGRNGRPLLYYPSTVTEAGLAHDLTLMLRPATARSA